jgi:hypothetical protein
MITMSSAKIASDQNGYAGIAMSAPIALRPAARIPTIRPYRPPFHSEKAAKSWNTPSTAITQPHVLRPLRM